MKLKDEIEKVLDKFAAEYEKWLKGENCLVYELIRSQALTRILELVEKCVPEDKEHSPKSNGG